MLTKGSVDGKFTLNQLNGVGNQLLVDITNDPTYSDFVIQKNVQPPKVCLRVL